MSDEDDDLFADSGGDTDDLIAESNAKPIAKPKKLKKKKAAPKKRKRSDIPDADNDDDDDGPGLFDSDDEDDSPEKKPMSKRDRMEALRAKKRNESRGSGGGSSEKKDGYDSGDSYDSADYVRTKEDNDFIDTEGDDADAINELYSEQIFDDERGEADEERPKKKKIKGTGSSSRRSERSQLEAEADKDNPIMQAVNKMKKKKRVTKHFSQLAEEDAKPLLARMEQAADEDDEAIAQKRPALKKLGMINEVCEKLANKELMRPLLEHDLLSVCKRWIQPLPNGKLGNVTVRQRLLHSISLMTGENGITKDDLRASEFGKVVMSLCMHKDETPAMKRQLKALIDQWSRHIFQKSGNMRDLERVHQSRGATGLAGIARINQSGQSNQQNAALNMKSAGRGGKDQDLESIIKSGAVGKTESGINRVRIPFSKGFHYSARPTNRTAGVVDKRRQAGGPESRMSLSKRLLEKKRPKAKNQRSANISIEGRSTKP
eukprot:scaffold22642_cov134-Cylindrotheca_fusiformis.AAC.12